MLLRASSHKRADVNVFVQGDVCSISSPLTSAEMVGSAVGGVVGEAVSSQI